MKDLKEKIEQLEAELAKFKKELNGSKIERVKGRIYYSVHPSVVLDVCQFTDSFDCFDNWNYYFGNYLPRKNCKYSLKIPFLLFACCLL